jgi:hypothetical protein
MRVVQYAKRMAAISPGGAVTFVLILAYLSLAALALLGVGFTRLVTAIISRRGARTTTPWTTTAAASVVARPSSLRVVAEGTGGRGGPRPKGHIETYFEKGRWKNKVHGSSRAANTHETKSAAVKIGREMARRRRVEHIIRNKDGTIGRRTSYGKIPRDIPA